MEEWAWIEPDGGGGNEAEIRQHGIAAADAGQPEKDAAEAVAPGDLFHLGAGIGDGDEARSDLRRADRLLGAREEILFEDVRLERGAGFARHDEERARRIDAALEGADLRGIGGIEHEQLGKARLTAEGFGEDLGSEARSANAQQ